MAAFHVKSQIIDSHHDLGINARPLDRLTIQSMATCSPLRTTEYEVSFNATSTDSYGKLGDTMYSYYYGPSVNATGALLANWTHIYNPETHFQNGYSVVGVEEAYFPRGISNKTLFGNPIAKNYLKLWSPIDTLRVPNASTVLLFLAQNAVHYVEPCDDPFYSAHQLTSVGTYSTDSWVSVMACSMSFQMCSPSSQNQCTGFLHRADLGSTFWDSQLTPNQKDLARRVYDIVQSLSLSQIVMNRNQNSLRAQSTTIGRLQLYLPPHQWMTEVKGWFDIGLAFLQQAILEYATGPTNIGEGVVIVKPESAFEKTMCWNQLTHDTGDTTSFSVLGLVVLSWLEVASSSYLSPWILW